MNKYKDLIELWTGLIKAIKDLIEETSKFRSQFRENLKNFKTKDHNVKGSKV